MWAAIVEYGSPGGSDSRHLFLAPIVLWHPRYRHWWLLVRTASWVAVGHFSTEHQRGRKRKLLERHWCHYEGPTLRTYHPQEMCLLRISLPWVFRETNTQERQSSATYPRTKSCSLPAMSEIRKATVLVAWLCSMNELPEHVKNPTVTLYDS